MKRFLLLFAIVLVSSGLFAQNYLYQEGFEGTPAVTSGGTPLWTQNTTFFANGTKSYWGQIVNPGDSSVLITNSFSTLGIQKVTLEFNHICKIEFYDAGEIYVSANNGVTWTQLTEVHYRGVSSFGATTQNKFTSVAYVNDWNAGNPSPPLNTWWKPEVFDISAIAANASQVKVMFMLRDINNQTLMENWGWAVDDIKVWTPSPQAAAITGIILPLSLPSGCGLTDETIQVRIANEGGQNINGNLTATFKREGQLAVTESVPTLIAPDDTLTYTFTNKIDLSSLQDTTYEVKAWITLVGDNNQNNDTTLSVFDSKIALPDPVINDTTIPFGTSVTLKAYHNDSITWSDDPLGANIIKYGSSYTTPVLLDTTVFYVQAGASAAGAFMMTEICHFKTTVGAPTGGWPTYLLADDYIEITGVPNSDLGGYTLEQWSTTAMLSSHTFLPGTILSPNGTAVIAVGQLGSSVPVPGSFYYHGNGTYTSSFGSTGTAGRILKDGSGVIIDAVVYGTYTFPAAAGVTAQHWSGNTPAVSSSGNRLVGPYTNSSANWVNSGTSPQNPNTLNTGVVLPTPSGCPSRVKAVTVNVSGIPLYNAGIESIISPVGPFVQNATSPVVVNLKNFASNPLTKVTIYHSVNGVTRPPYLWTGNLPYNQTTQVTLGTDTFLGGSYTYRAWTSMPNDSVDGYTANDSALAMAYVCLAGTFTLGDASSDFPDFASLQTILGNVGICGPTTIRIKPGTYTQQLTFSAINGASDTSRLIFESFSGLNTDVIIQHTATSTANWTLRLDGADYVTFRNLTIKANDVTNGRVVELINGATYNVFEGNRLISAGASSSTTSCIYDYNTLNHYNTYLNNYMQGGYYTLYIYGSSSTVWEKGTVIQGNEIVGSYYYPMYIYYGDSVQIVDNHIHSGVAPYSYGIALYYVNNAYRITGNIVKIVGTSTTACYGIRDYYCNYYSYNANPTGFGLVANNMVSITGATGVNYGIYAYYSNGTEFYFNTINIGSGSSTARALYFYNTASNSVNQTFKNNIFSNTSGGYAAYYSNPAQVAGCDYNNYYTSGLNLTYWSGDQTSLAAHKVASGKDANSLNINPPYNGAHDLTLTNTLLSAKGVAIPQITTDIFGTPRGTPPTIGAHEVPLIAKDAGVMSFVLPTPQSIVSEGGSVQPIVTIMNFGTDTLYTCDVYCSVNQGTPLDTVYTGMLLPFQTATVTLPSFVSPAGNTSLCAWTVLPGDTNYFNDTACMIYFATPTIDAIMTRIIPIDDGCGMGLDTVKVVIRNIGATTITGSFDVMYKLKGDTTVVTQSASGPIAVNDSIHITFSTLADFTTLVDSLYEVISWVDVPGDNVAYNDTATLEVLSLKIPLPPIVSDTTIPYATYVTLFAQSNDSVMWYQYDTSTVELHTGAFYTTPILFDTTTYWVEATSGPSGMGVGSGVNIAPLAVANASNCSTGPCSSFNDLNYGTCGTQQVWISTSGGPTPHVDYIDFEWPAPYSMDKITIHHAQTGTRFLSGGDIYYWNGTAWVYHHTFSNLPNTVCENDILFPVLTTTKFRITSFVISGTQLSNPNFREIEIFSAAVAGCASLRVPVTVNVGGIPPYDLGISELAVKEGCAVYNEPVTIKIFNQGTDTLKGGATASYRINNNPYVPTETIPDTIAPGSSIFYTFNALANLTAPLNNDTMFTIKAWIAQTLDPNHQNDSIIRDSIISLKTPQAPTSVSPVNILYNSFATLQATGLGTIQWYPSQTSALVLDTGSTFITPILWDTTTYWASVVQSTQTSASFTSPGGYTGTTTCGGGFMVDITALSDQITIEGLDMHLNLTGSQTVNFFYRVGTWVGFASSSTSWIPWGTYTVTSAGPNQATYMAVNPLVIPQGQTYAIYWQVSSQYGSISVNTTYSNADIAVFSGMAHCTNWDGCCAPRQWNGTIYYKKGSFGCPSLKTPVTVNVSSPPPVDAGIEEIVNPHLTAASNIPHPIQVKLKNYGLNSLVSANIVWSLNNVIQDTFPWTGSLVNGATQVVTLDTMAFAGGVYCLKAWTTLPNGLADTVPLNDTANHCFNACLAGVYTIGPATTGTWNYNTFNQAVNALTSVGICGHVIFDVQPGVYTEQVTINSIAAMNANNTVTFRGATGDSTAVTLQYTAAGSTDYWTIRLNGADWFRFEKMTIKGLGITYARAIEFMAGADNNIFSNCVVEVPAGTTTYYVPIYSTSTSNDNYNQFLNNRIVRGYYGMYWYGTSSTNLMKGTIIKGNVFEGWYYYGAYLYYHDSLEFTENRMTNLTGFANGYGLYAGYCQNDVKVTRNKIEVAPTGIMYGGIYMYYCTGTNARKGLIANNFISVTGAISASVNYGIRLYYSNYQELMFNSVNLAAGAATSRAIDFYYGGNNNILNNYGRNSSGGYAYYVEVATAVNLSNYNNWYSSGSNLAYWATNCTSLAALKLASGKEANSHNLNVLFNSPTDLHLMSSNLSAKGQANIRVPIDIDGEIRSSMPTIGADEVPLIHKDAGVTAIIAPAGNTNEGQVYPVQVVITNFGIDTLYSTPVQYTVNGGTPVVDTFNGALPTFGAASMTLPSMTSPAGNSMICAKTLLPNDSNAFNDEFCKSFFATPINDATVMEIVGLVDEGCGLGLDTISIWVKNLGLDTINAPTTSAVTVSYRLNSSTVVTESFTPVVSPNDSVLFHFATQANFSVTTVDDTIQVSAWVDLFGDNVKYNDTAFFEVISLHTPLPPAINDTTIPYGTSVTLFAASPDSVTWYDSLAATQEIATGNYFTTPVLYNHTTYWVQAGSSSGTPDDLFLGPHNSNYAASQTRGYHFTAPVNMVIKELMVPTSVTPGTQYIQVVKFSGYPIVYPGGSQFTTLALITNAPFGVPQQVNIPILAGDEIGIIGATHSTGTTMNNSYGGTLVQSSIGGFPVTLTRLVYQSPLVSGPAATGTIGMEINSSIARVEMKYVVGGTGCASLREPVTVFVANQQPCDIGISNILEPVSAISLGSQENVKVRVTNYGTAPQTNFLVNYQINNNPVVTETVTATVASNGYIDYSFVNKANLAVSGTTYQIKAWTGLSCDNTHQNDTAWKSVTNLLPSYCISTATSALYSEITNVTLNTLNNTSNSSGAMYTNYTATVMPTMVSPGVNYTMNITSSFAPGTTTTYGCWVKAWVDFNRDGVFDPVNEMILSQSTNNNSLITANIAIPFTAMTGNTVMRVSLQQTTVEANVTPCNTYTYGETEDYMVTIAPQSSCDAGVIGFIEPGATVQSGISLPVYVKFMNFGSNPIAPGTLSVAYMLNGGAPVVVSYPGGLPSGGIDSLLMPSAIFPMGNNTLCATTILGCDSATFNNEICIGVYGQYYTSLPYFDDFEAGNNWYKPAASANWQYGTPSANMINAAYSGNKAYVTNLTGDYSNNCDEHVYTPVFDFSGMGATDTITLSFYHWCAMAASDYGQVQYNLNGGSGWANLGYFSDPMGTNWYNTQSGGVHYFSLSNSGWQYSGYKLSPTTFNGINEVQFRFRFYSNASGTSNGWAIDNFRLALPLVPNDVGITAINYPLTDTAAGSQVNVKVTITNFGTNTQTLIPLDLKLNGAVIATETWTGVISPQGTSTYTFVLPFTVPSTAFQLCAETQLAGDAFPMNNSNCHTFSPLPAYHDVGVSQILAPSGDAVGNICFFEQITHPWYQYPVSVRIKNYGQNTQTTIPISYTFYNGGTVYTDAWQGNLAANDSVVVILDELFLPKLGAQQICVETALIGDGVSANNKTCKTLSGVTCIGIDDQQLDGFVLGQNIPNPATQITTIGYYVPQQGDVSFGLVTLIGQVIHSEIRSASTGYNQIEFDVSALATGVYFYFVEYNGQRLTRKLVVNR